MTMIELITHPHPGFNRAGAKFFVATSFLCFFLLFATRSAMGQGGTDTAPIDTAATAPLDSMLYADQEDWRIGVYFGVNANRYAADNMPGLPGVPSCCPSYNSGGGIGLAIGGMMEYPVNEWFSIGGRVYLETYNGALVEEEDETVDAGGVAAIATFEHRIDADIWTISVEPIVLFDVTNEFKVFGGLRGDVVARKRFSQSERILAPDDIRFENDKLERLVFEGLIPQQTSTQGSIVAGARYDFDFGTHGQFVISPEVSFWYGFTPVVTGESWKVHGLRLAVSGQFLRFISAEEEAYGLLEEEMELMEAGEISGPETMPADETKGRLEAPGARSGG